MNNKFIKRNRYLIINIVVIIAIVLSSMAFFSSAQNLYPDKTVDELKKELGINDAEYISKPRLDDDVKTSDNSDSEKKDNITKPENDPSINEESKNEESANENSEQIKLTESDISGEQAARFFVTGIDNGKTVSEKNYSFFIRHLKPELQVKKTSVKVNDSEIPRFSGSVLLSEGKNTITISVTYEDNTGNVFHVSKKFEIYLNTSEVVIITSLVDGYVSNSEEYSFTAVSEFAGNKVDLSVTFNGKDLDETDNYNVSLLEGDNEFILEAKNPITSNVKREKYVVGFKGSLEDLSIETDLSDQETSSQNLAFSAKAFYKGEEATLEVIVNDEIIGAEISDGRYEIDLDIGENTVVLNAVHSELNLSQTYQVIRTLSGGGGEEEEEKSPTIETDLEDGISIVGSIKTIDVIATDYHGEKISASGISVICSGESVTHIWDDSTKTSYKLDLFDGENNVSITATDDEGNSFTREFTIYADTEEENEVIGTATVSVEATTIGMGYIIPPTTVEIREGQKFSYIFDELMNDYGYSYSNTGTLDSAFYLARIHGLYVSPNIPADLDEILRTEEPDGYYPDDYDSTSLGEFDFSAGSGWMYMINGSYPNYGFADAYLNDGAEVRIRFTLWYGKDINGFGATGSGGSNWGDW